LKVIKAIIIMKYTQIHNLALSLGHSFCSGWSLASSLRSWSSACDARPHCCIPTCQPWMRSPLLLTTRAVTVTAAAPCVQAAGPPHLPLQVACLGVVEVPLPAAGLYLAGAPADGVSACRQTQLCPRSTSCRPSAPAPAGCLPRSSPGA